MKSLKLRRTVVALGVVASLLVGAVSIEAAAALTAAAAPPPAPPMSLSALQEALAAQQQRGDELQAQLVEMNELTASLSETLAGTQDYITTQGKTAQDLEAELKAAQAKLSKVQHLLDKAQARLAALRKAAANVPTTGSGSTASKPAAPPPAGGGSTSGLSLTLSLSGGGVRADWSGCNVSGFAGYALVRSTDGEVHYPPEDHETEVAHINSMSTTAATDASAPSGRMTYRVYCLYSHEGELKVATKSASKQIVVP